MPHYATCPLSERYPLLKRIPPNERAAWVAQAEAGEALTPAQCARVDIAVALRLVPVTGPLTPAQVVLRDTAALYEVVGLGRRG
jgi:hypothetical protein